MPQLVAAFPVHRGSLAIIAQSATLIAARVTNASTFVFSAACYSMSMLKERLQVLIDRDQRERLEREAHRRGASVGRLVREAIDLAFPEGGGSRRDAAARLLDAEPMPVPGVAELRRERDELRERRA